ncbi:hypothetical protein LSAT2_005047 [Lamellibrachia satsuma]|nr:hypothetical protein LSAT2_005047 [Lamellibrachia satsuma]
MKTSRPCSFAVYSSSSAIEARMTLTLVVTSYMASQSGLNPPQRPTVRTLIVKMRHRNNVADPVCHHRPFFITFIDDIARKRRNNVSEISFQRVSLCNLFSGPAPTAYCMFSACRYFVPVNSAHMESFKRQSRHVRIRALLSSMSQRLAVVLVVIASVALFSDEFGADASPVTQRPPAPKKKSDMMYFYHYWPFVKRLYPRYNPGYERRYPLYPQYPSINRTPYPPIIRTPYPPINRTPYPPPPAFPPVFPGNRPYPTYSPPAFPPVYPGNRPFATLAPPVYPHFTYTPQPFPTMRPTNMPGFTPRPVYPGYPGQNQPPSTPLPFFPPYPAQNYPFSPPYGYPYTSRPFAPYKKTVKRSVKKYAEGG